MFVLTAAPLLGPCALLAASAWRKLYCLPMVVFKTLKILPSPFTSFHPHAFPPYLLPLMAFNLAHNFAHPLLTSFAMKDNILFGCYAHEGKLIQAAIVDDALGELREEEIVWGEAEMHYQYKDVSSGAERGNGKVGMAINRSDHRVMRQRSMLSRQLEMQANTWSAGSAMSTVGVAMQSAKGGMHSKAAADHKDQEAEGGGGEEEGGIQQCMDELVPPHELLARQYAATATNSFSVLHGAGRTLKGRDLRRLRNEVWRQTGFAD